MRYRSARALLPRNKGDILEACKNSESKARMPSLPVTMTITSRVAIITVDNPPVNALSHAVRAGLAKQLSVAVADDAADAIVLICAGRTFFAGADITEFGKPARDPSLRDVLAQIDASPKLTVAAIHGTALGGGLETALACHHRIAVASAKVGLPESQLGLLPGAGGTQRLPRLVGAEAALDMMISGNPINAGAALDNGILDRVIADDDLQAAAVSYAGELLRQGTGLRRVSQLPSPEVGDGFFDEYSAKIKRRTRGFEAPERIVACVRAACEHDFARGLEIEGELFAACMASTQSAAMRHLFFAERAVAKLPGIDRNTPRRPIETVGVVGSGTMGAGIALACMNVNLPVVMLDTDAGALARGRASIEKLLAVQVDKGRLTASMRDARMELLTTTDDYGAFSELDLAIEAVFETMAIKQTVFRALDAHCKPGAILATNTSTLDVDLIAKATARPEDVVGLHFFSPAHVMRLLEIVRGRATSIEVIASSLSFGKQVNKIGVVVGNCFGFVGNRMFYGYTRESQLLLLEGAAPEIIDQALTDWGMAMGPNAVGDLAGLDVSYKVRQERTDLPDDPRYFLIATLLAEAGRYGQKTGKGTYRYEAGSRTPLPDPEVQALIAAESARLGIQRRTIPADEIVERCIYALIVEGCRILEEGFAVKASDIDVIWVNGYGFPRYRGGPMLYADLVGLDKVYRRVCEFRDIHGEQYWQPPALLRDLARSGGSLAAYPGATTP